MDFAALNAEFVQLRNSLRTFVGEDALDEISVQPPVGQDETAFLRLISWSYVLLFEAGRVTVPYLIKLPSSTAYPQADVEMAYDLVHDLRTWSFHNLGFYNERDIGISKRVFLWFIETCGANPPDSAASWRACFRCLCTNVGIILQHCKGAVGLVLSGPEDGQGVIADLKLRLNRNWPAHRFDELVSDAAMRLGRQLDIQRFRQPRLVKWRAYLETVPQDADLEVLVVRLIERDLLDHFESVLPIDGNDVMSILNIDPGPEVAEALRTARRLFNAGTTDRGDLLCKLAIGYSLNDGRS